MNQTPPENNAPDHTEEDLSSLFPVDHIDDFLEVSDVQWPMCLEITKDLTWYRLEKTGKFYRISKELYYVHGTTKFKQVTYKGEDKETLMTEEQYSLVFGNLSKRDTLASLSFFATTMQRNSFRVISNKEFELKLEMISKDFEEFISKEYEPLKIDSKDGTWIEQEEQRNDETPF